MAYTIVDGILILHPNIGVQDLGGLTPPAFYHELLVSNPDLPSREHSMHNVKRVYNGMIAAFSREY